MSLPQPVPGRCALVTGASSGIGAEIARELSRRGHELVLVARSGDRLEALAAELPTTSHPLAADLADPEARAELPGRVTQLGLRVDVLVNNAGFSTLGPAHRADPEQETRLVEVDIAAVVELCSRFLPAMVQAGAGAVLNVASTAAFQPLPGQAAYGAAKAFVLSYTQALSAELAGTGVSATALCPGPVDTGFGAAAGFTDEEAKAALPAVMWLAPTEVARQAVDGMARGRGVVIPGVANKVGAAFARLAPRRVLLPVLAKNHPGLR